MITEYRNITLTPVHMEFQENDRGWKEEKLTGLALDVYQKIMHEHKPTRLYEAPKFSWEIDGVRYRGQITHASFIGWIVSLRKLTEEIPTFKDLSIPHEVVMPLIKPKGITLFSGPLDSGKSTTMLAACGMLGVEGRGKTLIVEDPIEYVHSQACTFQREIGTDVLSAEDAIYEALRENMRTVIIGEIRTPETMQAAVQAGLNGLRVLGTIHGEGVVDTIEKISALLCPKWRPLLPRAMSGIYSQVLVRPDNHGSDDFIQPVPIYESVLITTPVRSMLEGGSSKLLQIHSEMDRQNRPRIQKCAERAVREHKISQQDASIYLG